MPLARHDHWPLAGVGWLGGQELNVELTDLKGLQHEVNGWLSLHNLGSHRRGS